MPNSGLNNFRALNKKIFLNAIYFNFTLSYQGFWLMLRFLYTERVHLFKMTNVGKIFVSHATKKPHTEKHCFVYYCHFIFYTVDYFMWNM